MRYEILNACSKFFGKHLKLFQRSNGRTKVVFQIVVMNNFVLYFRLFNCNWTLLKLCLLFSLLQQTDDLPMFLGRQVCCLIISHL